MLLGELVMGEVLLLGRAAWKRPLFEASTEGCLADTKKGPEKSEPFFKFAQISAILLLIGVAFRYSTWKALKYALN